MFLEDDDIQNLKYLTKSQLEGLPKLGVLVNKNLFSSSFKKR